LKFFGIQEGMLNGIFKLANISRPGVVKENPHGLLGDSRDVFADQVIQAVLFTQADQGRLGFLASQGYFTEIGDGFNHTDNPLIFIPHHSGGFDDRHGMPGFMG